MARQTAASFVRPRVALEEKGVLYHLIEPDILRARGFRLADLLRYLAAQQPKLVEGGFALFDCDSILRYVDEAFDGPQLQPADPKPRAMMVEVQASSANTFTRRRSARSRPSACSRPSSAARPICGWSRRPCSR